VKYADLDFGSGVSRLTARVSAPAGARVEIRSGGTTGTLLGVLTLAPTGAAGAFTTHQVSLAASVTGVHSLYLIFQGSSSGETIDSFVFA
jgi:hypothetical protein